MTKLTFTLEKVPTPTGHMLVITDGEGFLGTVDWGRLRSAYAQAVAAALWCGRGSAGYDTVTSPARREIEEYLAGNLTAIDELPIKTGGTDFQRTVWAAVA
jgi:methylated-DNA-[protein]-cysteine S-methyltransferase